MEVSDRIKITANFNRDDIVVEEEPYTVQFIPHPIGKRQPKCRTTNVGVSRVRG